MSVNLEMVLFLVLQCGSYSRDFGDHPEIMLGFYNHTLSTVIHTVKYVQYLCESCSPGDVMKISLCSSCKVHMVRCKPVSLTQSVQRDS